MSLYKSPANDKARLSPSAGNWDGAWAPDSDTIGAWALILEISSALRASKLIGLKSDDLALAE